MKLFLLEMIFCFNEKSFSAILNAFSPNPDICPSTAHTRRLTAFADFHLDGDPSGSVLKDRGSSILDARFQLIMGYTLMAARVGQLPIQVFTLMVTLREAS